MNVTTVPTDLSFFLMLLCRFFFFFTFLIELGSLWLWLVLIDPISESVFGSHARVGVRITSLPAGAQRISSKKTVTFRVAVLALLCNS